MNEFIEKYAVMLQDRSGLDAIYAEMSRQSEDIRETLASQKDAVNTLAADILATKNVLLLGMGASQLVNEIFALQIRRLGIEAHALTASGFIYDPIPTAGKTVILTSQSGESIETVKCLPLLEGAHVFGVTMTEGSTIAGLDCSIICAGGTEKAYAGTRSVTLTLAAFAGVCAALGQCDEADILPAVDFERSDYACMDRAVMSLWNKSKLIATGRSLLAPVAHLYQLGSEELSNHAVIFEETGTLRHGPMETVDSDTMIVAFRQTGTTGELVSSFTEVQRKSGCSLIVFDASGMAPLHDAITIPCPTGDDIIAALGMMTTFQYLMIAYACGQNPRTGLPRYGSKVTVTE